ncbi:MAG: S-methyl-5-thioribose-1-phosphate isomerase [Chloroflexi bacterium]|nr:S-methyl-5-thioribose-1-phosphate isomerase [Chloroflexota bacterium]
MTFHSVAWVDNGLRLLDQRALPQRLVYNDYHSYHEVAQAIREMVVRGAPAIGAAAAFGMALAAAAAPEDDPEQALALVGEAAAVLKAARPTAVNLSWAVERMLRRLHDPALVSVADLRQAALAEAQAIAAEDVRINRQIAVNALSVVPDEAVFIHHCNTGSLATVDYGTALGVIRMAHERGKKVFVLVDETRPRLQGARLTAWELQRYGVPFKVIVDSASGHFMRTLGVDLCVVGADRIAANGDTANKIGTYNLAIVAHEHGVPFYVAAPTTTLDLSIPDGSHIEIEERPAREITHVGDCAITPAGAEVANPAFDVTPARYITGILTEAGIAYPPFATSLARLLALTQEAGAQKEAGGRRD